MNFVILVLILVASVSPLLTFASLWQVKEWRVDRLREHLRAEGALRQLFGIVRPAIAGLFAFLALTGGLQVPMAALWMLFTLAGVSVAQIALHRQRTPVWTSKAITLVATGLILMSIVTLLIAAAPQSVSRVPIILFPLLQPLFLICAWALWKPVDWVMKRRIMEKAKALRAGFPDLTVIGITGSVGKTTTKELLAHLLPDALVTPAHVNTEMGVSQWLTEKLLAVSDKTAYSLPLTAIIEMGAYASGEIAQLCRIAQPTIGAITFIGTQHIALFGSQQALCSAKAELLDALPADGHAFLNKDSSLCDGLAVRCRCPVTTVGTGGHADLEAFDIEETAEGIRFRVGDTAVALPLRGTHNVVNVLLAIAIAERCGVPRAKAADMLRSFRPPQHTFSVYEEHGVMILDDTHNASPESFRAAMAWARTQPSERKTLLASGLIEQGEEQDRVHMELGAYAADIFDDVIFLHDRSAQAFARGFGRAVAVIGRQAFAVPKGSLLVCVGRMPLSTIQKLLP